MSLLFFFFFFNDTATTEIYTLSLHDALPISTSAGDEGSPVAGRPAALDRTNGSRPRDRKSTRLNSSHSQISYAVFCLKKKKKDKHRTPSITMAPRDQCWLHDESQLPTYIRIN